MKGETMKIIEKLRAKGLTDDEIREILSLTSSSSSSKIAEKARVIFSLTDEEFEKLNEFLNFIKVINTRSTTQKIRIYIHKEKV
ncbi:MAG: hypothetical protein RMJ67_01425 [Elusimicrobiota bacterium]|nr:hypothetical protein [Endomicrobiia bacterium]MDW8165165.1 hypothetical protein [Elusimicrobiota bacterium]